MTALIKAIRRMVIAMLPLIFLMPFSPARAAEALLAVVGDPAPQVYLGHEKHCVELSPVERDDNEKEGRLNVVLAAGQQNWFKLTGEVAGKACESIASLVPEAGVGYIARLGKHACQTEIYRVQKDAEPRLLKAGNEADFRNLICAVQRDGLDQARLAVMGNANVMLVGHAGYCGKMETFSGNDKAGAVVNAGEQNWVRLDYRTYWNTRCQINFSFMPVGGKAYYLLADIQRRTCTATLFQVHPDGNIAQQPVTPEAERSCLFQ